MVVVEKANSKLRICLDPRPGEEIISQMALDASNGYWNIKVDEESSDLLTFRTVIQA